MEGEGKGREGKVKGWGGVEGRKGEEGEELEESMCVCVCGGGGGGRVGGGGVRSGERAEEVECIYEAKIGCSRQRCAVL